MYIFHTFPTSFILISWFAISGSLGIPGAFPESFLKNWKQPTYKHENLPFFKVV